MKKIVVVGSLNMDLVVNTAKIPAIGETVLGNGFYMSPGGKGANQAVAVAKLGGQVIMIGCVGNDLFGEKLVDNLLANKVDTKNIRRLDGVSTGIANIVISNGNNFIIVDPGANYKLSPEMIAELESIIDDCSFLVVQLEIPMETVEMAISIAKKHGVKVLLNPAPAMILANGFLNKVDILVLNETESQIITSSEVVTIDDARKVVSHIQQMGVRQIVVTMGNRGAVYNQGNNIIHVPAPVVETVDTTAAGDSFIGAFIIALSQGKDIDEAVHYANFAGALTVTKKGAQTALPDEQEIDNFIMQIKNQPL